MDNFANIGKAVLIQALGLQKNYIEVVESTIDVIDYSNSECANCKWNAIHSTFKEGDALYEQAIQSCAQCPYKQLSSQNIYKKVYHNEKNRYGYKPRLKNNAIRLLLLLHFLSPDKYGIVQQVDCRMLAESLDCNIKTVFNNLNILSNYQYISYSQTKPYIINLCLSDVENYYLPAQKGGRGFIVMSKELLSEILALPNLLALRLHLRELIELDNLNMKAPFFAVSKRYSELKRMLPEYCKPCMIRSALKDCDNIFAVSFSDSSIRFELYDKFNSKVQKERLYQEYLSAFENFLLKFNSEVPNINTNQSVDAECIPFIHCDTSFSPEEFCLIKWNDLDLEDLAQLAMQYSYNRVLSALCIVYRTYMIPKRHITNLGGLLRTIVLAQFHNSNLAA